MVRVTGVRARLGINRRTCWDAWFQLQRPWPCMLCMASPYVRTAESRRRDRYGVFSRKLDTCTDAQSLLRSRSNSQEGRSGSGSWSLAHARITRDLEVGPRTISRVIMAYDGSRAHRCACGTLQKSTSTYVAMGLTLHGWIEAHSGAASGMRLSSYDVCSCGDACSCRAQLGSEALIK